MNKLKQYLITQFIPYAFWFMMGAGALLVYLAATDYRCRLDEASLTQLQIRAMEEETRQWMWGPVQPDSVAVDRVRPDWLSVDRLVGLGL